MAFEKNCIICKNNIESHDLFVKIEEDSNFNKLIIDKNNLAHINCFQKYALHGSDYAQLKLFK